MSEVLYQTIGRRKSSIARISLKKGSGKIIVNKRPIDDYFSSIALVQDVIRPLQLTSTQKEYDIIANADGGGFSGQAGALRLAISRALAEVSADFRSVLKKELLIRVDSRVKERKKYGKLGARRSPQFSKR